MSGETSYLKNICQSILFIFTIDAFQYKVTFLFVWRLNLISNEEKRRTSSANMPYCFPVQLR